jgi:cobalamin biosynthesis Mg chelatase CobN
VDLSVPTGYVEGQSITVTLHLSEITSSDGRGNIRVLHLNGSTWEKIKPNAVSAGSVTVTLNSLSPVAVVRIAEADELSEADDTSNTQTEAKTRTTTDANETSGSNTNSNTNTSNTGSSSSGGNTQTNNNNQTVNVYTTGNGTSASAQPSASTSTTSPKTGASLPALPILAVLAAMGIAVCGKKARSLS